MRKKKQIEKLLLKAPVIPWSFTKFWVAREFTPAYYLFIKAICEVEKIPMPEQVKKPSVACMRRYREHKVKT